MDTESLYSTGIARGRLNERVARLDAAGRLCILDHPLRDPVFHLITAVNRQLPADHQRCRHNYCSYRSAGVEKFALGEQLALKVRFLADAVDTHHRRLADRRLRQPKRATRPVSSLPQTHSELEPPTRMSGRIADAAAGSAASEEAAVVMLDVAGQSADEIEKGEE